LPARSGVPWYVGQSGRAAAEVTGVGVLMDSVPVDEGVGCVGMDAGVEVGLDEHPARPTARTVVSRGRRRMPSVFPA
jgi:hypothetical protein